MILNTWVLDARTLESTLILNTWVLDARTLESTCDIEHMGAGCYDSGIHL